MINRVTITGADNSTTPQVLVELSAKYPFVEWGILLSQTREGTLRFPSLSWMETLRGLASKNALKLSGHLCGRWVRDMCMGLHTFRFDRDTICNMFQRVQFNFHAENISVNAELFSDTLKDWGREEYIFQYDDVNNGLMQQVARASGMRCVPLFDTSGGAGIEPENGWPAPIGDYCGYAGGLHPDTLDQQIEKILKAAGKTPIWIDVESHVRSYHDRIFDTQKVTKFLDTAAKYVNP